MVLAVSLIASCLCLQITAAEQVRPNLLLLFPDEWRWDWAGFDAPQLRVPTLKSLAARGTRFSQAYTPSPVCESARACLASVKEYDEVSFGAGMSDYLLNQTTWASLLQRSGYHTMTTGKDDLTKASGVGIDGDYHAAQLGYSDWLGRTAGKFGIFKKAAAMEPYGVLLEARNVTDIHGNSTSGYAAGRECYGEFGAPGACCSHLIGEAEDCSVPDPLEGPLYLDDYVAENSETLLARAPSGKPWALHVSFPGPHPPFIITKSMNESIGSRTFPPATDYAALDTDHQMNIRRQYAAEIENLDSLMAGILRKLELSGQLSNTLVVVTSDHGEELGDHGNFGKAKPWEGAAHVPLLVSGPGVAAGRVVDVPVTTLDVIGTFLDRANVTPDADMTAVSLWLLLSNAEEFNRASYRDHVNFGLKNFRAVVKRYNASSTLKLVCCEGDCPQAPSYLPPRAPTEEMQVLLFNLTANAMDMVEIHQRGSAEIAQMVKALPQPYDTKCAKSIETRVSSVAV